jgi:hypothetical protein
MNSSIEQCPHHPIGANSCGVAVEWNHNLDADAADRALFVFTEVTTGNQTQYEVPPRTHICISLLAGLYRVAVFAKGLETHRTVMDLRPGLVMPLKPVLNKCAPGSKTLNDVVARFDIKERVQTRNLDVPANSTVVLDSDDGRFKSDWRIVELKDVETAKRIIGHSDDLFPGSFPRFQRIAFSQEANPVQIARQAAREFIYGNSATVKAWTNVINESVFQEIWRFPLFIFDTVTINAGGVLVIGDQGNFFVCERLRMHVTATLLIRGSGPIHVEPISLETFC